MIEVDHRRPAAEVSHDLARMARDLAERRFADWAVTVDREGEDVRLRGARDTTRFEALLSAAPGRVVVTLSGAFELGRLKLTLAGGPEGVRERVRTSVTDSLRSLLA